MHISIGTDMTLPIALYSFSLYMQNWQPVVSEWSRTNVVNTGKYRLVVSYEKYHGTYRHTLHYAPGIVDLLFTWRSTGSRIRRRVLHDPPD
jgi:hypothetical protein